MSDFVPPAVPCEKCGCPHTRLLWTTFPSTDPNSEEEVSYQFTCDKCQHSFAVTEVESEE